MSLIRAIFRKDNREALQALSDRVNRAAEENRLAAKRLIETIDVCGNLRRRDETERRALISAMAHKQRRFKGQIS